LDIDYDVMFTEACYPDSSVQSAGRINRSDYLGNNGEDLIRFFLQEGRYEIRRRVSAYISVSNDVDLLLSYTI
jgi:CRISPR/Cas system-associated endonuclease/helicase Cas3